MIKITLFLKRHKDVSHEDFVSYHENYHAPLFWSLPEAQRYVRRYEQFHYRQEPFSELTPPDFDGIAEIWFDDMESMYKLFSADAYSEIIRADQEKFMNLHDSSIDVSTEWP